MFLTHLPGTNGHHFGSDIFRCFSVNEKFCILIKKKQSQIVPTGPVDKNRIGLDNGLAPNMRWIHSALLGDEITIGSYVSKNQMYWLRLKMG